MLKVVLISDTHSQQGMLSVPPGNILIHAGDATANRRDIHDGTPEEMDSFLYWMSCLPHPTKIFVPGNHDLNEIVKNIGYYRVKYPSVSILLHDMMEIDGVRFYGCATMWGIGNPVEDIKPCDFLITHQPPECILDSVPAYYPSAFGEVEGEEFIGSRGLFKVVQKIKPRYHVFGHVHQHGGTSKIFNGTHFYNLAACNHKNELVRGCSIIDIG